MVILKKCLQKHLAVTQYQFTDCVYRHIFVYFPAMYIYYLYVFQYPIPG